MQAFTVQIDVQFLSPTVSTWRCVCSCNTHGHIQFHALCQRLYLYVQNDDGTRSTLEKRVEAEVARLQEQARADMAAVRAESKDALHRETRMLRDMRDHAQLEADRVKGELKDCKQELEDVLVKYRALQRKVDVDGTALAAELRLRTADAERAEVCFDIKDFRWNTGHAQLRLSSVQTTGELPCGLMVIFSADHCKSSQSVGGTCRCWWRRRARSCSNARARTTCCTTKCACSLTVTTAWKPSAHAPWPTSNLRCQLRASSSATTSILKLT